MPKHARRIAVAAALALTIALSGCAASLERRSQQLADRIYPGKLTVVDIERDIGAPVPVPVSRTVFRFVDDPAGGLILDRLDETELRAAYERAQRTLAQYRGLKSALDAEGLTIASLGPLVPGSTTSASVVADVTPDGLDELETRLSRAALTWATSAAATPAGRPLLVLSLYSPAYVSGKDEGPAAWPEVLRLSSKQRGDALSGTGLAYESRLFRPAAGGVDATRVFVVPRLNYTQLTAVGAAAESAAKAELARSHPDLQLGPAYAPGAERLANDSTTGLRRYLSACERGGAACSATDPPTLVAVTVDVTTNAASDVAVLDRPTGGWTLPIEPR